MKDDYIEDYFDDVNYHRDDNSSPLFDGISSNFDLISGENDSDNPIFDILIV